MVWHSSYISCLFRYFSTPYFWSLSIVMYNLHKYKYHNNKFKQEFIWPLYKSTTKHMLITGLFLEHYSNLEHWWPYSCMQKKQAVMYLFMWITRGFWRWLYPPYKSLTQTFWDTYALTQFWHYRKKSILKCDMGQDSILNTLPITKWNIGVDSEWQNLSG